MTTRSQRASGNSNSDADEDRQSIYEDADPHIFYTSNSRQIKEVCVHRDQNGIRSNLADLTRRSVNAAALAAGSSSAVSVPYSSPGRDIPNAFGPWGDGDHNHSLSLTPSRAVAQGSKLDDGEKITRHTGTEGEGRQDALTSRNVERNRVEPHYPHTVPELPNDILNSTSTSFRVTAIQAVKHKHQQERWKLTLENVWCTIRFVTFFFYVFLLLLVAGFEMSNSGIQKFFLYLLVAIVAYTVPVAVIWLTLMVILLRGRLLRHLIVSWFVPTRHYPLYSVVTSSPASGSLLSGRLHSSSTVELPDGRKVRKTQQQHQEVHNSRQIETGGSAPSRTSSTGSSFHQHSQESVNPATQGELPKHVEDKTSYNQPLSRRLKSFHVGVAEPFTTDSHKPVVHRASQGLHSAVPPLRRAESEFNWLQYCWKSQKERMRRGELQYVAHGALPYVQDLPHVHKRRPSRHHGFRSSQVIDSSEVVGMAIQPYISCPNLCITGTGGKQRVGPAGFRDGHGDSFGYYDGFRAKGSPRRQLRHHRATWGLQYNRESQPFRSTKDLVTNRSATLLNWTTPKEERPRHTTERIIYCFRHPLRFLCSVNWLVFPFQTAIAIHSFPAFQIALLFRNVAWCGLYIWATALIYRDSSSDPWNMSHVPAIFWHIEEAFMWMITWDYIIALFASQDALRFVFSLPSLIDLATMPTAKLVSRLLFDNVAMKYWIHFGSLRILRLVRLERILSQIVPWIGQVKLRLISLVIGAFVITLMFASTMFILEAPYKGRPRYTTLYDFLFFAVVTISTVGYGDFAPEKPAAKAIVMVAIVVALAFLPTQIQKLVAALQSPPSSIGRIPTENQDYIVISGPIDPRQLTLICRELSLSLQGCCTSILVISPTSVVEYTDVIRSAFLRGRIHVAALRLDLPSLKLRSYYRCARAVFIVGNVDSQENNEFSRQSTYTRDPDVALLEDDHNTLLRFQGAQHICWPDKPICVQLNDGTARHLVTEMGAYHVVCLQHIKMKLMAKTCAGCPGFNTLVTNLFYQPLKDLDLLFSQASAANPESKEAINMRLYLRGARYQLYRLEFPDCFRGLPFTLLLRFLAARYEVYCLGVACVTKEYWLNPVGYCIGDELSGKFTDWPFAGVVAASSLRVVQQIASLKTLDIPLDRIALEQYIMHKKRRSREYCLQAYYEARSRVSMSRSESHQSSKPREAAESPPTPSRSCSFHDETPDQYSYAFSRSVPPSASHDTAYFKTDLSVASSLRNSNKHDRESRRDFAHEEAVLLTPELTPLGVHIVPDVRIAKKIVFKNPEHELVVVCGWPRGIPVFLSTVLQSMEANIVILAPYHPSGISLGSLLPYVNLCVWVKGSGLDVTDLMRAGILEARSCAVFSAPHVPWKQSVTSTKTDTQAILVRRFVYALHNSDAMIHTRLQFVSNRLATPSVTPTAVATTLPSVTGHHPGGEERRRVCDDGRAYELPAAKSGTFDTSKKDSHPADLSNDRDTVASCDAEYRLRAKPFSSSVVIELRSNNYIEFLDSTPLGATPCATGATSGSRPPVATSWKRDYDLLWAQDGFCAGNPEYTSGRVLLEQMLHGIIAFSLPVSRYCMDSRIIDQLVDGLHVPLPEGVPHTCPTWIEEVPQSHQTATFGDFMDYILNKHLKLAFAIYRCTRKLSPKRTPLDILQGTDAFQYVVITCPPVEMPLQKGDLVYVLQPCPIEALGLLLAGEGR